MPAPRRRCSHTAYKWSCRITGRTACVAASKCRARKFTNAELMYTRKDSLFLILALICWSVSGQSDERLWAEARINGQPVRLIFDTGADRVLLFPEGAKRLGLKVTQGASASRPEVGQVACAVTEPCRLTLCW